MGALDYLSNFCSVTDTNSSLLKRKRRKQLQTVELKVKMDCDGCERKVKNAARSIKGVTSVEVIRKQSRVIVTGHVDPNKVLNRVKSTGKRVEIWPYIPHNVAAYPHANQVYDKRAPSGYVRNVIQALPAANAPHENYISMFSDDNPNACSIM